MNKSPSPTPPTVAGDVVLREVWRAKDTLSASYGHDLDRLFAETRERQNRSGCKILDFSKAKKTTGIS